MFHVPAFIDDRPKIHPVYLYIPESLDIDINSPFPVVCWAGQGKQEPADSYHGSSTVNLTRLSEMIKNVKFSYFGMYGQDSRPSKSKHHRLNSLFIVCGYAIQLKMIR